MTVDGDWGTAVVSIDFHGTVKNYLEILMTLQHAHPLM